MGLLHGRAGHLTAQNGGFWPGQWIIFYVVPRKIRSTTNAKDKSQGKVISQLRLYGGMFIFIWFWGLLNRILTAAMANRPFFFLFMHALLIPMQVSPMPRTILECQVSKLVDSDACPRPTRHTSSQWRRPHRAQVHS